MSTPILATKLYTPPPQAKIVVRPRLIKKLNEALGQNQRFGHKLTLISAPAGFGKTTLVSEWLASSDLPASWLSLDEGDNDPTRFLAYLIAALQTIAPSVGAGVLAALQSPQPPSAESILTTLLNEVSTIPNNFILVLDDYHVIDAKSIDDTLTFLLEHMPPQMQLVITTREDPPLPLGRYRVRGQLTELRAIDLRFTPAEAAEFLNKAMGLTLSVEEIAALEIRTEGWIAGLQLAALALQGHFALQKQLALHGASSMQKQKSSADFIQSFTGSHRFVLDYLVEEVLQQQPTIIQTFLLQTAILDRMCGPLCDAVLQNLSASGQETLTYLEQANLFIVPLDNERRWFRYHHLFADLLRQRLQQSLVTSMDGEEVSEAELHRRASIWYEDNGLDIEAFHHAAAADGIDRAAALVEGQGMPLIFRGAAVPVLNWLASLPTSVLDARPSLWVIYASALLFASQTSGVEEKLQAAEAALEGTDPDDKINDLIGHIASIRATLAVIHNQVETIIAQSQRALAYLHPDNLPVRTATTWTLGVAYQLQGDHAAAKQAYAEAISISQAIGHNIITVMATIGLGQIQEKETQLRLAAQTYQNVLSLVGEPPLPVASEAYLGLARIQYEWNDLDAAQQNGQKSLELARQLETDRFISCGLFLSRLKLAQGDIDNAVALLVQAEQSVQQHNFLYLMPEVAAAQVLIALQQGDLATAVYLTQTYDLPLSQARVHLAQNDPSQALTVLETLRQQVEAISLVDKRLRVMVLQALAYRALAHCVNIE